MKISYVCEGAKLRCKFGNQTGTLNVKDRQIYLDGQPQASTLDYLPGKNIPTLGTCTCQGNPAVQSTRQKKAPCKPLTVRQWVNPKRSVTINGVPVLLKSSLLMCNYGGVIRITDTGSEWHTDGAQLHPEVAAALATEKAGSRQKVNQNKTAYEQKQAAAGQASTAKQQGQDENKAEKQVKEGRAVILVHGLNSEAGMWEENMIPYLLKDSKFIYGGKFTFKQKNLNFDNINLFGSTDNIDLNGSINVITPSIKEKVQELTQQGMNVLFTLSFFNNQDDFRREGAYLKTIIDIVKTNGKKVNVVAHSMGGLATASYISGISGFDDTSTLYHYSPKKLFVYGQDIDKFIALGSPFKGAEGSYVADAIDGKVDIWIPRMLIAHGFTKIQWQLPGKEKGPAYKCLQPTNQAIKQLQNAWNTNYKTFQVKFYTLQSFPGDMVVTWGSSTSLKGATIFKMPYEFHVNEPDNAFWRETVYMLLAKFKN